MRVLKWSRMTLIVSFAIAMMTLLLYLLQLAQLPVMIVMLGAMAVALVANLIYAFACAASWIEWVSRKR